MSAWHPDRKNPLILLVDDSKTVRRMGRDALESVGLDVVEAGDGRQAVRAFSNHQPDLVLLDIKMPKLDGFDVCEEIRRTSAGAHVPVMMVTSCDDLDSIRRAYEVGATDFATKPLNWLIISQRIRYMLRMGVVLDELRMSQERLALAQRTARLGSWQLDLRTGTVAFSDELGRLYGLPSGPREIEVKSPGMMAEYWRRPEATREAFRDGWFRTGDVAVIEDGDTRILGRMSLDIIKTGGYKVSALEIEEALRAHPDIEQCAVVGLPDAEWGERVGAALVLKNGRDLTVEELRRWTKTILAAYKAPAEILELDDLPRNAAGKVTKPEIKKLFEAARSKRSP